MCGGDQKSSDKNPDEWTTPKHLRPVPLDKARSGDLVVEEFPVTFEGYTYRYGRIAYVKGRKPAPLVLVHHNYAGLKQFDIDQACFLARVGYVGLAVDSYKESPEYGYADRNPKKEGIDWKQHFVGAFTLMDGVLRNPRHWRGLMGANLDQAFAHPAVQRGLAAAIGYCLGGQAIAEQVRGGHELQAAVSFHGILVPRPFKDGDMTKGRMSIEEYQATVDIPPASYNTGCKVLLENGAHDHEVPIEHMVEFFKEMDDAGVEWRFNNHCKTPHGFALGPGVISNSYVESADRRSTQAMLQLFAEVWPQFPQRYVETNASGTTLGTYNASVKFGQPLGAAPGRPSAAPPAKGKGAEAGKGKGKGKDRRFSKTLSWKVKTVAGLAPGVAVVVTSAPDLQSGQHGRLVRWEERDQKWIVELADPGQPSVTHGVAASHLRLAS